MIKGWWTSPLILGWLAVGVFIHVLAGFGLPRDVVQLMLGSVGLAHSTAGFWSHGRHRISAPNVYLFATGLFVFFPAIYLIGNDPITGGQANIVPAVSVCYFSQVILMHVFWAPEPEPPSVRGQHLANSAVTRWGTWTGTGMVAAAVTLRGGGITDSYVVSAVAFAGIVLLSAALLKSRKRLGLASYLLIALGFLAYVLFVFSGFGRLEIGALALTAAIVAADRWPGRAAKVGVLAATAPGLMYLAASRAAFTASLNPAQSSSVNGLESVVSPLVRFAQLIEYARAGALDYTYFGSVYATATFWVPRSVWGSKPLGLGAELANLFAPELEGTGHSELGRVDQAAA